jgi:probable HAF family extracellular repeat protein
MHRRRAPVYRSLVSAVLSLSIQLSPLVAAQDVSYSFTTIDYPGAMWTLAYGINTAGQVVGEFYDAMGMRHGFLKDGATYTPIDVPGASFTHAL